MDKTTYYNECGTCTLCCKLLGVKELKKEPGIWCEYTKTKNKCDVYHVRPQSCRDFKCFWLESNLPKNLRPDKSNVVLAMHPDRLCVWENIPGARFNKGIHEVIKLVKLLDEDKIIEYKT